MRVLLHEPRHEGHFYRYLRYLAPTLRDAGLDVVVALSATGIESKEFQTHLGDIGGVAFSPMLLGAAPRDLPADRFRTAWELRKVVLATRADYALIPSGDAICWGLGAAGAIGLRSRGFEAEIGIHHGLGAAQANAIDTFKDDVRRWLLRLGRFNRVHLVNTLFYEYLVQDKRMDPNRFTLMPDPIPPMVRRSLESSRRWLGLPEQGRYVGLVGSIDQRKAVGPMLRAFERIRQEGDGVLIAGKVDRIHRHVIDTHFQHLIDEGALFVHDGFLERSHFEHALSAVDIVCTPYPGFQHLSGMLLHALAAGRPVVAGHEGWTGAMIRRFEVGWSCDLLNSSELERTLRNALDESVNYRESLATKRLLEFHSPDNFANSWVSGIQSLLRLQERPQHSWSWVIDALPADKRYSA